MILEKRPILLVLVLHFLCALCDDDALTSKGTTIAVSATFDYDSEPTENPGMIYERIYGESTENHFTSYGAITTFHESTVEPLTTDSQPVTNTDKSSSSMTVDQTTYKSTTVPDVISTDNTIICDPTWPIDASEDTKEVVNLRTDENGISAKWIVLLWESPYNATNVSVTYSIERGDDKYCIQSNETVIWHNATDLDPCTQYTFKVKILTNLGESKGVNLSVTTIITEIGDVVCLKAQTVSINIIQLTWQAPAMHVKCISDYSILQCNEKSNCNESAVSASFLNYTAKYLEPCTEYQFTVKTVTPTVNSTGVNGTAKTASPKLSAPQSFDIIPGNFSLTVKWEPPKSDTICLKHYHVTTDLHNYSENVTNTSVIISNLHACKTYQVSINAVNKDDKEGDMIRKNGTTLHYKTNAPVSPAATGISPSIRSLSMIWIIQKENNHCLPISIITKCNYTEKRGKGYEPENNVNLMDIDSNATASSTILLNITIDKLSPFTSYTCWAHTVNNAGSSDLSDGINATTLEDVPSPPIFSIRNITDSQFSLFWDEPDYLPGHLEEFEIVIEWNLRYPIPNWCSREDPDKDHFKKFNLNRNVFEYDYLEAKAFTDYRVYMRAKTGEGWSNNSDLQTFLSSSRVPGPISKFNSLSITIKENSDDANVLDTILTWGFPCSLNGELEFFNVSALGTRGGYPTDFISNKFTCMNYSQNDYMCSINLNELKGEYNYTFTISTKVRNVDTLGEPVSQNVLYPAGIPPQPNNEYIKLIALDPYKVRKSTTTAAILLPLFSNISGDVKFYAIMVAKEGYNRLQLNTRFDLKSKIWPNTSSWEEAMMNDFSITYQATEPNWNPYPKYVVNYGHVKAIKYMIGEDPECKEVSANTVQRAYCNGPLKPGTWYHVRMRAFTDGGYADSELFLIKTNAELNVALVIGAVFGILSVGILVTMMLLVRRCSPHIYKR